VISIGEGTGEFVASLATRHPSIRFIAFDYHPSRILIARRLVDALGLDNVRLYVGSAALIPFPLKIFQGAIERGVFHVLPHELKVGNLSEIERVCAGRVIMTHMVNTTRYLLVRLIQSIRHRRSVIWTDAYKTFRMIEPGLDSLRRLANFVQQRTGHEVSILHNFHGDVELSCQSPRNPSLEYLGGLTYVVPA
jgi:ubiquinone/menaquinone biosynthesis C-methylase UbiE